MQKFSMGTELLAGPGAIEALRERGARRLFLVTDPYFAENGWADRISAQVNGEAVEIFKEVTPDPSLELAAEGTARFQAFKPDLLLALGGGSAMDTAKAILYFSRQKVTFGAIPTTSGSGSEVTDFAILTYEGVKHPLVDPGIRPDFAILDSDLLEKLPQGLIADAGFDVLSHALEAWVGKNAGYFSDLYAKEAFSLVYGNLLGSFQGDLSRRLPMHMASCMAGIAFSQAGLGLCHGLSHSLGGRFHVPHGRLNAILLPQVIRANSEAGAGDRYGELALMSGLCSGSRTLGVRNLISGLIRLRRQLGLPGSLRETGISEKDFHSALQELVDAALRDPCCETNPVPVTEVLARQVLEDSYG